MAGAVGLLETKIPRVDVAGGLDGVLHLDLGAVSAGRVQVRTAPRDLTINTHGNAPLDLSSVSAEHFWLIISNFGDGEFASLDAATVPERIRVERAAHEEQRSRRHLEHLVERGFTGSYEVCSDDGCEEWGTPPVEP